MESNTTKGISKGPEGNQSQNIFRRFLCCCTPVVRKNN